MVSYNAFASSYNNKKLLSYIKIYKDVVTNSQLVFNVENACDYIVI